MLEPLAIQSHRGPYTVRWDRAFTGLEEGVKDSEHLLIDARVAELYRVPLSKALAGRSVLRIEATEPNKSLERVPGYARHLIERGIRRDHLLIAVGGGIIQDITAFLAATLLRGLPWRFYPTTLLAQADSCIGSKSSINIGPYKNQIGTFTPPNEVVNSSEVLRTLAEADVRSGIGEMLKVHVIAGWEDTRAIVAAYPRLLCDETLLARYIRRSLQIKQAKVEVDEFDRGERLIMNYGHSFGHAIESATDYVIPHGIAVTIGMDLANYLSWQFGIAPQAVYQELHPVLAANYAGFEQVPIPEEQFFVSLGRDKKNVASDVSLILLRAPGDVFCGRYPNDARLRSLCTEFLRQLPEEAVCQRR